DITTTTGIGFRAETGGTVTVQGAGNTISSGTGTALRVVSSTIGALDMTFQSISAGTAAGSTGVGINLDTTGALGGLHVTGTGGADTGGTIRFKGTAGTTNGSVTDGVGINLNDTDDVDLNWM